MNGNLDCSELIKNQIYKLENDLKVKQENEKHLIYENETLFLENDKLLKKCCVTKDIILKLESEIKKLKGDLEDFDDIKIINEALIHENNQLKADIIEQSKINKSLKKPIQVPTESPSAKLRQIEYQYINKIKDLNEKNIILLETIESQRNEFNQVKHSFNNDNEIMKSKIENYKEIIEEIRREKENKEFDYLNLQNEFNKPDFNRQGNNMYCEVDDRRIQAEKVVLKYQDEVLHLRRRVTNLKEYLEKAFAIYSDMKEDELKNFKRDLFEKLASIKRENQLLVNQNEGFNEIIKMHVKDSLEVSTDCQVGILKIQKAMLENEKNALEKELINKSCYTDKMRINRDQIYKKVEELTFENSSLRTKIEKLESKLSYFDRTIPVEKLKEYEEQLKNYEQSLLEIEPMETDNQYLPAGIFGRSQEEAKFSDKLVFDVFGNPVRNKLTKKICPDPVKKKKEIIEIDNAEPKTISYYDYMLKNKDVNKSESKNVNQKDVVPLKEEKLVKESCNLDQENITPCNNNNVQEIEEEKLDEVSDCRIS